MGTALRGIEVTSILCQATVALQSCWVLAHLDLITPKMPFCHKPQLRE